MTDFKKYFKKEDENKGLKILAKVFFILGIIASLCVIAKILYDKFKKDMDCFDEEDCFDDYCGDLLDEIDAEEAEEACSGICEECSGACEAIAEEIPAADAE